MKVLVSFLSFWRFFSFFPNGFARIIRVNFNFTISEIGELQHCDKLQHHGNVTHLNAPVITSNLTIRSTAILLSGSYYLISAALLWWLCAAELFQLLYTLYLCLNSVLNGRIRRATSGVADPDLEISGRLPDHSGNGIRRGPALENNFPRPYETLFSLKIRWGPRPHGPLP